MSISVAKPNRHLDLGRLQIHDLNQLLRFNKGLFLSRGEICQKTSNSFVYLRKVLEKRSFSFKSGDLLTVRRLKRFMDQSEMIQIVLERVEEDLLHKVVGLLKIDFKKRREILQLLSLSVYLEFCVFMMFETNPDFKKIQMKRTKLNKNDGKIRFFGQCLDLSSKTNFQKNRANQKPKSNKLRPNDH